MPLLCYGRPKCNNNKLLHVLVTKWNTKWPTLVLYSVCSSQSDPQKKILWQWYLFLPPGVRFSLRGTTFQNNSLVTLEDIGEWDDALLCMTDLADCCRGSDTPSGTPSVGDWFFPNGTAVPNTVIDIINGINIVWKFYRNRGPRVVRMNRRNGGVDGIYHCEIPVSLGPPIAYQKLYIGVYTASTGELYMYTGINYIRTSIQSRLWLQKLHVTFEAGSGS